MISSRSDAQDDRALQGARVLLTRPASQAQGVAAKIEAAGGVVMHLPLLEIDPVTDAVDVQRIKEQVMALDRYDIALFVSTNAARIGLEWIRQYWPQLPAGLSAYTVGPGTAAILREETWPVHCPDDGITSEHLLVLPGLQEVQGKRVALFRGQGGREVLAHTLRERGAMVDYIEIYQRRVPHYVRADVLQQMQSMDINVAVLTSQQIVEAFIDLLDVQQARQGGGDAVLLTLLQTLRLIVPSQRVADVAVSAGFAHVMDAGGADDDTVVRSLMKCRQQAEFM